MNEWMNEWMKVLRIESDLERVFEWLWQLLIGSDVSIQNTLSEDDGHITQFVEHPSPYQTHVLDQSDCKDVVSILAAETTGWMIIERTKRWRERWGGERERGVGEEKWGY